MVRDLLCTCLVLGAATSLAAPPESFIELRGALPEAKKARVRALARFADSDLPSLDDRI